MLDILDIFFRILNFVIFSAIVVYYFRKKGTPKIKEQILTKKAFYENLLSQGRNIENEYRNLQYQIEFQERFYKNLESKVALWESTVNLERKAKGIERLNSMKQLEEKINLQTKDLENCALMKKILPKATSSVLNELKDYFKDTKNGFLYNKNIIDKFSEIK